MVRKLSEPNERSIPMEIQLKEQTVPDRGRGRDLLLRPSYFGPRLNYQAIPLGSARYALTVSHSSVSHVSVTRHDFTQALFCRMVLRPVGVLKTKI